MLEYEMKTQPKKREHRFKQIDYSPSQSLWLLRRGYVAESTARKIRLRDYDLTITVVEYYHPLIAKFVKTLDLRDNPYAKYSISKLVNISSERLKWGEFRKIWSKLTLCLNLPLR